MVNVSETEKLILETLVVLLKEEAKYRINNQEVVAQIKKVEGFLKPDLGLSPAEVAYAVSGFSK